MMCPVCGLDTAVKDSRMRADGVMRRRRVCENGHRNWTYESYSDTTSRISKANEATKRYRAKKPDWMQASQKRQSIRKIARKEAAKTGEPVEVVYQRWGVA